MESNATNCRPREVGAAQRALLHAAYLAKGFMRKGLLTNEEQDREGGEIGAIAAIVPYADVVRQVTNVADQSGLRYPGVFEYQVTEEMGSWLRENPGASEGEFRAELKSLTLEFFRIEEGSESKSPLSALESIAVAA